MRRPASSFHQRGRLQAASDVLASLVRQPAQAIVSLRRRDQQPVEGAARLWQLQANCLGHQFRLFRLRVQQKQQRSIVEQSSGVRCRIPHRQLVTRIHLIQPEQRGCRLPICN